MVRMALPLLFLAALPGTALGHGIFWSPTSRAQLSQLSGWEADATKIISEPMPEVASGRPYPGGRPFAEPGKSLSNVGPCGRKSYDQKTNWNHPAHGWGDVQATFTAGDIVSLEWCVADMADHGGLYSYRMCTDEEVTRRFIDPAYTPTAGDEAALEDCFQRGILACTDVPGQSCPAHPDCRDHPDWGCARATSWFSCGPKDGGRCAAKGVGRCRCHGGEGALLRDRVRLPNYVSNHTLIGFRWDSQDTPQLWLHCADVALGAAPRAPVQV